MSRRQKAYFIAERIAGRQSLMRLGRWLYCGARREFGSDMTIDGEHALIRRLARVLAAAHGPATILDVGANLGGWSLPMGQALEEEGVSGSRLLAFEPGQGQRERLESALTNAQGFANVTVLPLAIGAEPGKARFEVTGDTTGSSGLLSERGSAHDGSRIIDVEVDTIDSVLAAQGVDHVDVMKIDTEGNDLNVLKGASQTLQNARIGAIQFEYNARWVDFRFFLKDVFALIAPLDYRLGRLTPDGVELYDKWHPELERFIETNYVLLRADFANGLNARAFEFDISNTPVPAGRG